MDDVESARLIEMLRNGPERRMEQDRARGLPAQRADVWQAEAYRARLAWLRSQADSEQG